MKLTWKGEKEKIGFVPGGNGEALESSEQGTEVSGDAVDVLLLFLGKGKPTTS